MGRRCSKCLKDARSRVRRPACSGPFELTAWGGCGPSTEPVDYPLLNSTRVVCRRQTVIRFYFLKFVVAVLCLIVVRGVLAFEPVVVTATRTAQTADQVLAPVTVISSDDIQNSQARDLGELLSLVPGIEFTRNGGYGKNTSIFMRGTNSGHVLTLIDGVKLYSATVGTTAVSYTHLTLPTKA